ncbi:MAG: DUF2924 domain-containing protein [Endomicrobium sp.]|nr:DUF2924 domain-containing protein [Endomicrobium sp.]
MELKKAIKEFHEEKIESYFPSQVSDRKNAKLKRKKTSAIDSYTLKNRGVYYTRKYKGINYSVKCLGDKLFVYRNRKYKSLTSIAKLITGYSNISGHVFFGLR